MVRQARSEATRKKIVDAAVELFTEVGYQATGLGDIIERAEMTKGALYYHTSIPRKHSRPRSSRRAPTPR